MALMAEPDDTERIVRSKLADWNFGPREKAPFDSAKTELPTWRAANQSRRHLAGITAELMNGIPAPVESIEVAEIDATLARQLASVRLGAIIVRTASAIMSLIACGHEREALASGRTILEALIRGRQVADDMSGEPARKMLQGRKPGTAGSPTRTCCLSWWSRHGARAGSRQTSSCCRSEGT
jgi:hypothetical protein